MENNEELFKKIEKKTKVDKKTILSLAKKVQDSNLKDVNTLEEVIDTLSIMTGKKVSSDQKDKIIKTIMEDKVPKDVPNMF